MIECSLQAEPTRAGTHGAPLRNFGVNYSRLSSNHDRIPVRTLVNLLRDLQLRILRRCPHQHSDLVDDDVLRNGPGGLHGVLRDVLQHADRDVARVARAARESVGDDDDDPGCGDGDSDCDGNE